MGLNHAIFFEDENHVLDDIRAEGVDVVIFVCPDDESILDAFFKWRAKHGQNFFVGSCSLNDIGIK